MNSGRGMEAVLDSYDITNELGLHIPDICFSVPLVANEKYPTQQHVHLHMFFFYQRLKLKL